jgi:hypothetical protein
MPNGKIRVLILLKSRHYFQFFLGGSISRLFTFEQSVRRPTAFLFRTCTASYKEKVHTLQTSLAANLITGANLPL